MQKVKFSPDTYKRKNPAKAKTIRHAVKLGMKQYAETFRRLAKT